MGQHRRASGDVGQRRQAMRASAGSKAASRARAGEVDACGAWSVGEKAIGDGEGEEEDGQELTCHVNLN